MNYSSLKFQLWSLNKKARFSVPLSMDGLVMLVIELIAVKLSLGDDWHKVVNNQKDISGIIDQARYLEETLHINTVELSRAAKHLKMPDWLRELVVFTDGLDTQTGSRKQLALLLMELLGEYRNYNFNFTAGLSTFLSALVSGYDYHRILGIGASTLDPLVRADKAEERVLLSEVEDELARLLCFIAEEEIDVVIGSPFQGESLYGVADKKPYSTVLASVPWRVKSIKGNDSWSYTSRFDIEPTSPESLYIQSALSLADDRVFALVPQSFLYKTAGSDQSLKKQLAYSGSIEAVIQLPRVFANTMAEPVLLVLRNGEPADKIFMADFSQSDAFGERGSDRFDEKGLIRLALMVYERTDTSNTTKVEIKELEANDFNLSVSRYLVAGIQSHFKHIFTLEKIAKLQDVAEIQRAQSIKSVDPTSDEGVVNELWEVMPADIGMDGDIKEPSKLLFVPQKGLQRADRQRVRPGDILLTIKGAVGKVAKVPMDAGENWVAGQSFVILREKPGSDIHWWKEFMYRYLSSELAQRLLKSRVVGSGVKMIKMQDLENLEIVIPDAKEQESMFERERDLGELYIELRDVLAAIQAKENSFFAYDMSEFFGSRDDAE